LRLCDILGVDVSFLGRLGSFHFKLSSRSYGHLNAGWSLLWFFVIKCVNHDTILMLVTEDMENLDVLEESLSERQLETEIHIFLKNETVNTASHLGKLRFHPKRKSKINIPLCRMVSLLVVRHFLKNDVMNFASHFVSCGYMEGNGVFYVAIENDEGKTMEVTSTIMSTWSKNWMKANNEFEDFLKADADLRGFSNKIFLSGMATIDCKRGYLLSTKTMLMILSVTLELKVFFWR
jgi:hypothetical protein